MSFRIFVVALMLQSAVHAQLDSAITYQGKLEQSGIPVTGVYDLQFEPYENQSGGVALTVPVVLEDVTVEDGLFSVEVDLGLGVFGSSDLWLEIGVRDGDSTGGFTGLLPRQRLTPVPFALHAEMVALDAIGTAEIASGAVGTDEIAAGAVGADEIAAGAVGSAELADAAVVAAKLAPNSVGAAAVVPSEVQRRVSGTCAEGTYLSGIAESGDVICQGLPVGQAFTIHNSSFGASIAVRDSGLPILAFESSDGLNVFDCSNVVCSEGTVRLLAPAATAQSTAMVIRNSGLPLIAYQKRFDKNLEVYDCADTACTSGAIHVLDNGAEVGSDLDIAMRSTGNPVISYRDRGLETVKLYDCSDAGCTSGTARTLGAGGAFGGETGIVVRSGDLPMVSWFDGTADELHAYDCDDAGCTSGTNRLLTSHAGAAATTGIIIGPSGVPLILSETGSAMLLFECSSASCSSGSLETVASGENPNDLAIIAGADGRPLIVYTVLADEALKVFDCFEEDCSDGVVRTLGHSTNDLDIALNADGKPLITFAQPVLNGPVRLYACGDARCEN